MASALLELKSVWSFTQEQGRKTNDAFDCGYQSARHYRVINHKGFHVFLAVNGGFVTMGNLKMSFDP